MSLSDINALREHMNAEFVKIQVFIKTTNKTLRMMQETELLVTDTVERMHSAMEDFTNQISMQQKQIRDLVQIVRQLTPVASPGKQPEHPEQSRQEPSPEQSDIEKSQPASDEKAENDSEPASHHNNESADSSR